MFHDPLRTTHDYCYLVIIAFIVFIAFIVVIMIIIVTFCSVCVWSAGCP